MSFFQIAHPYAEGLDVYDDSLTKPLGVVSYYRGSGYPERGCCFLTGPNGSQNDQKTGTRNTLTAKNRPMIGRPSFQ
jgi:hypothetical protein